ncbi:hypothetical protein DH2020_003185 [Rehmannia glutinosa]|uniref:Uncharacterized protein n=1 Tax=Rehmannia glutinosa TaxID=99300 RepID=A0ABR0XL27_REHGL
MDGPSQVWSSYGGVCSRPEIDMSYILKNYGRLRILDAKLTRIKELSSAVGNLKHLRYLNLSATEIRTLPDSLGSLWNLRILNLNYCSDLVTLPQSMRYLKNLRHLFLEDCTSLSETPSKISELTHLRTLSVFIVGHNRGNQLDELQCLNLGGKLEIRHLERVKNPMDAKKVNLGEKKNLRHLSLLWEGNNESKLTEDIDEKVLEALEPHPSVETLEINGFNGMCFPAWMTNSTLKKVVEISIVRCQNCLRVPQLKELPHLKTLRLENLGIEYILEDEVHGGKAVSIEFPFLKELYLCDLPNLKGFFKDHVLREVSPNLLEITILRCSSFKLPPLSSFKLMHKLICSSSTLASVSKFDSLTTLWVQIDKNMAHIPIETLKSFANLETLVINLIDEVCVLPDEGLRALKSLARLTIEKSKTLTCLPQGWLQHLSTLETLYIFGCTEFVELPEEIKHLKSLATLDSLPDWLGNIASLKDLYIRNCPKLASLPTSIQGMQNLKYLIVEDCPELERRCQRGKGEDWHKIAHIPYLRID